MPRKQSDKNKTPRRFCHRCGQRKFIQFITPEPKGGYICKNKCTPGEFRVGLR